MSISKSFPLRVLSLSGFHCTLHNNNNSSSSSISSNTRRRTPAAALSPAPSSLVCTPYDNAHFHLPTESFIPSLSKLSLARWGGPRLAPLAPLVPFLALPGAGHSTELTTRAVDVRAAAVTVVVVAVRFAWSQG